MLLVESLANHLALGHKVFGRGLQFSNENRVLKPRNKSGFETMFFILIFEEARMGPYKARNGLIRPLMVL